VTVCALSGRQFPATIGSRIKESQVIILMRGKILHGRGVAEAELIGLLVLD
jgi:hypothetical protein